MTRELNADRALTLVELLETRADHEYAQGFRDDPAFFRNVAAALREKDEVIVALQHDKRLLLHDGWLPEDERNRVAPETAEANRDRPGAYTFNAPLAEDFEGVAFTVAAVRIGDHAHVHVESGRAVSQPHSLNAYPRPTRGFAGKLTLRWHEWLILRDVLVTDRRFHIAEVEHPTVGQAARYAGDRP